MTPYYPEESRWKKKYEMTIPIILLILVLVAVAWKMGWLPLEAILGGGVTNVLIVGEDQGITNAIDQVNIGKPVNYKTLNMNQVKDIEASSYLEDYDVIVLTEKLGDNPGDLPGLFRSYVSQRLSQGADLILYGVAGSRDPSDPMNTNGWIQNEMEQYIPVTCQSVGEPCESNKMNHSGAITSLSITDEGIDHPILTQFGVNYEFSDNQIVSFEKMNSVKGSKVLANLKIDTSGTPATPAVVQRSYGVNGGTAIYFAYHPAQTPEILKNTIDYLAG